MEAAKPIPTAAEKEAAEKERVQALKDYRKNKPKVWYLK